MSSPTADLVAADQRSLQPSRLKLTLLSFARYGPGFVIETLIFWVMLRGFQQLNYGGVVSVTLGQSQVALVLSVVIVVLALGAAEARFKLYRRIWAVAGIHDAIATGLAVAEATVLITLANWVIPSDWRPYRFAVPILAAPAALMGIGLYRLLPRLLSRS